MQRLYAVVFFVSRLLEGTAIVLELMANFVKNLFIDVSLGRTPLLHFDFSVYHCTAQIIALAP